MIISGSFYIPIIPLLQGGLLQKRSKTLQTIRRTGFVAHIVLSCNRSPCRENIPNSLAFTGGRGLQFQGSGFWIGLYRRFSGVLAFTGGLGGLAFTGGLGGSSFRAQGSGSSFRAQGSGFGSGVQDSGPVRGSRVFMWRFMGIYILGPKPQP